MSGKTFEPRILTSKYHKRPANANPLDTLL
jgi:hypothetical protein